MVTEHVPFLKSRMDVITYRSYCTIPLARGHSRSDTIEHILHSAREISAKWVREIVLTGVNIGDFGKQHGESFIQLIRALDKLEEIVRIRISSVEPDLLSDEIIDVVSGSGKFMPHFHIPLQSGSDKILEGNETKIQPGCLFRKS